MSYVQGATNAADPTGATIAATFTNPVGSSPPGLVRGYVSWGTPTLTDLNTVTDDKGNSYTIVDKVADTGNNQSFASFYKENITNGPKIITANLLNTPGTRSIAVGEYSNMATVSALDGHAMQKLVNPGTGANLVTSGNGTTTVNGNTVTSGLVDTTTGSLTTVAVGTGFGIEESGTAATIHMKTEDLIQGTAGAIAGTWTDATNGAAHVYIIGMMAFKAGAGGVASAPTAIKNIYVMP